MPLETTVTAQLIFFKAVGCTDTRLAQHPSVCLSSDCPATPGYQANQGNKMLSSHSDPLWRTQVWFPEMIQLLSTAPWSIPLRRDLLSKVQGKIWHPQPELLGLHVWPLNGTLVNSRRESLIQLKRLELPLHDVSKFLRGALWLNPPHPKTMPTWDLSIVLGALKGPPFEPLQQPA